MDPSDDPLWLAVPADPFTSETHGEHRTEFVSRHSIAETGLICPSCGTEVAPIGDYTMVRHSRLGDVIKCNGKRMIQDEEFSCGKYLVASPDTEHGDHIEYDRIPREERFEKFCRFVRITEDEAIKRKHGRDVRQDTDGNLVTAKACITEQLPERPRMALVAGQIWQTDDGRVMEILRVQVDNDPTYHGWAWGRFQNSPDDWEWHIDPTGAVRQSMRDPTQNDHGRLTTEIRKN
jgi:hypothetical protein